MTKLTVEEITALKKIHQSLKDKRKADRVKIILYLDHGFTQKETAALLMIDENTVTKWKQSFINRTDDLSWFEDKYVPYWGKLSSQQISILRKYCMTFKVQNKQEILAYIETTMGIKYDMSSLQKLLRRYNLSYQKMHRLPGKVDIEKQAVFVERYETIVSELTDNEGIMFIDAVHPQHNTEPSKIWSVTGQPRWINSNTGRERININGAYNPFTQDVITRQDKTINSVSTIKLFEQITKAYQNIKSQMTIFSDNGRANKSVLVKEWVEKQSFIKVIYLPPYSPNLNLIERLWKFTRKEVIHTKFYPEFKDFKAAINHFFDNIDQFKPQLKTFIGLKFQRFTTQT
jgi:transposase